MNGQNNKYPHYPQTVEFLYDLRGLLVHCGAFRGRGGGHYIALVSDVRNNWYNIDNDDVTPINNIKRDVSKYFGGTNCVMMAMYIKRGCDNKYIFNSHNGNAINVQNHNASLNNMDNNSNNSNMSSSTNRIGNTNTRK